MFKLMGICMIVFSCITFAYQMTAEMKRKILRLKQIVKALSIMKNEIAFSAKDISNIIEDFAPSLSTGMDQFFMEVSGYLKQNGTSDFGQAWCEIKNSKGDLFGSVGADKVIFDFANQLGKLPRAAEIENFTKTIEVLKHEIVQEEQKYQNNRKVVYALSVCAGFVALILFI